MSKFRILCYKMVDEGSSLFLYIYRNDKGEVLLDYGSCPDKEDFGEAWVRSTHSDYTRSNLLLPDALLEDRLRDYEKHIPKRYMEMLRRSLAARSL